MEATFVDIFDFSDISSFMFKENHILILKKDRPSEKVVLVEEELYRIDIGGSRNLEDLLKLALRKKSLY